MDRLPEEASANDTAVIHLDTKDKYRQRPVVDDGYDYGQIKSGVRLVTGTHIRTYIAPTGKTGVYYESVSALLPIHSSSRVGLAD